MTQSERIKVLGGPGCGKSYELMQKYMDLCNSGYTPEDITLITFRKSSADDLVNSVTAKTRLSEKTIRKHVGTIHSIYWRIGGYNEVITGHDVDNFIKEYKYSPYMKINAATSEEDSVYSGNLFDLYTWMRNTQTVYEKWMRYPGCNAILLTGEDIPDFMYNYDKYKKQIGKIDYSDMLQSVIDNDIDLDTSVLMVDEFQDLTSQMYHLFNKWVVNRDVVMVAGDPFQSIYGFWGGSPTHFNEWNATEKIIRETRRLPEQIQRFAAKILKFEGMKTPEIKAKSGYTRPIISIPYSVELPVYNSELHLIRCNYQAGAIAFDLARSGKLFSGLCGWTADEIMLVNALLAVRSGRIVSKDMMKSIVSAYPVKMFGKNANTEDLLSTIDCKYIPELSTGSGTIPQLVLNSILPDDPTLKMKSNSKLLTAKINGVLNRISPIMSWEPSNRKLLTIHGSKDLKQMRCFSTPRSHQE